MKRTDQLLVILIVLPLIAMCQSTQPTPAKLWIIDSTPGAPKVVGAVLDLATSPRNSYTFVPRVTLTMGGRTVVLAVTPSALVGATELLGNPQAGNPVLDFASSDCSGQGYWTFNPLNSVLPGTVVVGPRSTVHSFNSEQAVTFTCSSRWYAAHKCTPQEPYSGYGIPTTVLGDLADYFTPPFRLRATPH